MQARQGDGFGFFFLSSRYLSVISSTNGWQVLHPTQSRVVADLDFRKEKRLIINCDRGKVDTGFTTEPGQWPTDNRQESVVLRE